MTRLSPQNSMLRLTPLSNRETSLDKCPLSDLLAIGRYSDWANRRLDTGEFPDLNA